VPRSSVAVTRNYDFDFHIESSDSSYAYYISKPVDCDQELHAQLLRALELSKDESREPVTVVGDTVNASADSFYSSQGRQTSFQDHNQDLIDRLLHVVPKLATLEMETFHLFHLAKCWSASQRSRPTRPNYDEIPPTDHPITPVIGNPHEFSSNTTRSVVTEGGRIRVAAVQMIFAQRNSRDFITPEKVRNTEAWAGKAVLECLSAFQIPRHLLHEEQGSVWAI